MFRIILLVRKVLEAIGCHRIILFRENINETVSAEQTERYNGKSIECANYSEVDVDVSKHGDDRYILT